MSALSNVCQIKYLLLSVSAVNIWYLDFVYVLMTHSVNIFDNGCHAKYGSLFFILITAWGYYFQRKAL